MKVEKPRVATVFQEEGCRKLVLTIPSVYARRDTVVMSHESLSVLRNWCVANNYRLDESKLFKPKKKAEETDDSELYTY